MKDSQNSSISSRSKHLYNRSFNNFKPNIQSISLNKSQTLLKNPSTPNQYFTRPEEKTGKQYYSKNFWNGTDNLAGKETKLNVNEIPASCFNDTMKLLTNSYYSNRVTSRQNQTGIASKSLDHFKTNKKEELASQYGKKINNFFKNSKDHNLERAKQKNIFMESLIEKHLDKFSPSENNRKTQYLTKYVDSNITYFDNKKVPLQVNGFSNNSNHFNELKNQMISQREDQKNKRLKNLQEEKETMKKTQLIYERENIENLQRKKIENEIFLKTNMRIHNERKEKEVVNILNNFLKSVKVLEKKEVQENNQRQLEYLNSIHRENTEKKRNDQSHYINSLKTQMQSSYYSRK